MTQETNQETVEVKSLDHFVAFLTDWHSRQVQTALHMTQIPEGSDVQLDNGVTLKLEGELHSAFQAGLMTALNLLGTLPFTPIVEEDEQQTS